MDSLQPEKLFPELWIHRRNRFKHAAAENADAMPDNVFASHVFCAALLPELMAFLFSDFILVHVFIPLYCFSLDWFEVSVFVFAAALLLLMFVGLIFACHAELIILNHPLSSMWHFCKLSRFFFFTIPTGGKITLRLTLSVCKNDVQHFFFLLLKNCICVHR